VYGLWPRGPAAQLPGESVGDGAVVLPDQRSGLPRDRGQLVQPLAQQVRRQRLPEMPLTTSRNASVRSRSLRGSSPARPSRSTAGRVRTRRHTSGHLAGRLLSICETSHLPGNQDQGDPRTPSGQAPTRTWGRDPRALNQDGASATVLWIVRRRRHIVATHTQALSRPQGSALPTTQSPLGVQGPRRRGLHVHRWCNYART
jgi:hypothetical protein